MNTLFSIIIPTYNRGYCIWKAIQSVQKQTYPNWELLVVDDGSTDNTKQVVAQFQKDPRIIYIPTSHKGAPTARNIGLERAKGDIVTYVDSDDIPYEFFLSIALDFFKKYPTKLLATSNYNRRVELYEDDKLVDFVQTSSSQKISVQLQDFYHWEVKTCGTGIFHKRIVIEKGIRWDESFHMLDDLDFILQMGRVFPDEYMHIPYALFEYPQKYGGDGICSNTSYGDQGKAFEKIYKKHKDDPLMQGQRWYPEKVEKYKKMQKDFEKGLVPPPVYKYFPEYFKGNILEVDASRKELKLRRGKLLHSLKDLR